MFVRTAKWLGIVLTLLALATPAGAWPIERIEPETAREALRGIPPKYHAPVEQAIANMNKADLSRDEPITLGRSTALLNELRDRKVPVSIIEQRATRRTPPPRSFWKVDVEQLHDKPRQIDIWSPHGIMQFAGIIDRIQRYHAVMRQVGGIKRIRLLDGPDEMVEHLEKQSGLGSQYAT